MDWQAILLSLKLATITTIVLIPLSIPLARWIAWSQNQRKCYVEALVALPLVLPPTVLGYYLLVSFSNQGWLGTGYERLFDASLAFSFTGLLLASLLFNLPFSVQPAQRAFEMISEDVRESAWCCGLTPWRTFWIIELPLARKGVIGAALLTFTHTLGEFGVVLMVGGNIPGETRTLSIAIFDKVEAFEQEAAGLMALSMVLVSTIVVGSIYKISNSPSNDHLIQRRPASHTQSN